MTKMEKKMNAFISRMENAMMRMTEEIRAIQIQNTIETEENGNDDTDDIRPIINIPLNDTNLEERVQALEFQMANVQEEIMDVSDDVDILVSEVTIIHADQVVQDERLLDVEDEVELVGRGVATLEENVNSLDASNAQLNVSVTALQTVVLNLDETVTSLEETTEGLSVEVDDLDSRVSDLEASGGNETIEAIAFNAHSVITPIAEDSIMVFPEEDVNLGNGYNSKTGEFTVPPEGAGVYFLYFYTLIDPGEFGQFYVAQNGNTLCSAYGDHNTIASDWPPTPCGAVAILNEGEGFIQIFLFYF